MVQKKQANLAENSDISAVSQYANKNKQKIGKTANVLFNFFSSYNFFDDNGFQNIFVYQPTFNTSQLKEDKGTEYDKGWKSKGYMFIYIRVIWLKLLHYILFSFIT